MSTKKSPESQIDSKRSFDEEKAKSETVKLFFEIILEKYAEYVTEGNNGVIFKFDINKLSPEDAQLMVENNIIENTSVAIKLLKVYRPGMVAKEFEMQLQAQQIIKEKALPDLEYAEVPRVYKSGEVNIPKTLQQKLKHQGTNIGERGEILTMDFIEGTDLATLMYQHVVKTHPATSHMANMATQLPISDLQAQTASALQFNIAVTKGNAAEQQARERKIEGKNAEKIYKHLKRSSFILPPDVLTKVSNTIRLWRTNNFYHNDLHERNVMIAPEGKVYIIDFGASHRDPTSRDSHLADEGILHSLKRLSATEESERSEQNQKVIEQIDRIKKIISKKESTIILLKRIKDEKLTIQDVVKASRLITLVTEGTLTEFIALCKIAIDENLFDSDEVKAELRKNTSASSSPAFKNLLNKYIVAL